jgi:hypothetical protein
MPERPSRRRPLALLDFAIAASAAVVPVMLGMLVLVAVIRPADPASPLLGSHSDRYASVRQVAALKTFETAIVVRDAAPRATLDADELLGALPACRRAWGAAGVVERIRHALQGGAVPATAADRVVAGLVALDLALQRFSDRPNKRVERPVALDTARWLAAARHALDRPVETAEYPGHPFRMRCSDLLDALATLTRDDARMLDDLAWRGTENTAVVARWQPGQQMAVGAREVTRRNPWRGVAGCIYLGRSNVGPAHFVGAPRSGRERVCALPALSAAPAGSAPRPLGSEPRPLEAVDDPRWSVPPSLLTLLQPLDALRQPSGARFVQLIEPDDASPAPAESPRPRANQVVVDGAAVDAGFSVDITNDPALQALAQKTVACYTGRQDVCRALGMRRREEKDGAVGQALLEGAMVRMAAVAVIDVASGRIEALAGGRSPCARQELDGPGRDAACDRRLPYPVQYRSDALLNPAVFQDAMPASTIKPIMAAAFLSDPEVGAGWLASERAAMARAAAPTAGSLRGQLMRSDSARFLDRMFCRDKGFVRCHRPWDIQATAFGFGWNAGCREGGPGCGKHDLLFGRELAAAEGRAGAPLALPVAYGRLMSEPLGNRLGAAMHLRPEAVLEPSILARCSLGADGRRLDDDDWGKCRGGAVVDVVAEGWGQGHARASALGVAGMMATLAAAANGQTAVRRPHLVDAVRGAGPLAAAPLADARLGLDVPAAQRIDLVREAAEVILSGLSYSHRSGTARTACEQVFDARRCREIDWLAGKTGTPSFPNDGVPLDELARMCAAGAAVPGEAPVLSPEGAAPPLVNRGARPVRSAKGAAPLAARVAACRSLRPYKWYVAAYRPPQGDRGTWTKAIAVLTERNWLKGSGQVHGAGDHGPNPAAEIAMQIVGRQLGAIGAGTP